MSQTDPVPEAGRVVRHYLLISGLFTLSASVIWGVNTLFLLDAGLDIFQVFVANSAFTVGTILFEIPTGVVADTTGRRRSFLLSAADPDRGTLAYVVISVTGGGLVALLDRVARARHRLLLLLRRRRGLAGRRARGPRATTANSTRSSRGADGVGRGDADRLGRWRTARRRRPRLALSSSAPGCWWSSSSSPSTSCTTSGSRPGRRRLSDLPDEVRQGAARQPDVRMEADVRCGC